MATRKTSQQAAAERIIKSAMKNHPGKLAIHEAWDGRDGQYITDGFRAVRLKQKLNLPVLWTVHVGKIQRFDLDGYMDPISNDTQRIWLHLDIPTKKALKAHIKSGKEKAKAEGKRLTQAIYDFGSKAEVEAFALPRVNAQYLIDMLDLLPGCTVLYPACGNPNKALYFKAENGDGVLLPIHKKTK